MTSTSTRGLFARGRRGAAVVVLASAMVLTAPGLQAEAAPKKPATVKTVKASVKGTSVIKVRWSKAKNATRYKIEVATNRAMTRERRAAVLKGRVKTVTGLKQGTTYYVRVRAYRGKKAAKPSRVVAKRTLYATPSTPTITTRGTGYAAATFSWTPATYATRYRVVISRGPGMAVLQRTPWQTSRTRSLANLRALPAGTFYYARVEASNSGKASRLSAPKVVLLQPYTPSGLTAGPSSAIGVTGTWSRATSAQKYEVQASPDPTFTTGVRTNSTVGGNEGFGAVNGLTRNTTQYLRVRSVSGSMRSGWSSTVSARTLARSYQLDIGSYNVACANPALRCSTARPWSSRRNAVADLLDGQRYDVVGLQELGTADVDPGTAKRTQAKDLLNRLDELDGRYAYSGGGDLDVDGSHKSGRWLLYDTTKVDEVRVDGVSQGGFLNIGYSTGTRKTAWAVWQVFQHRRTGERFVVVDAHTDPYVGLTYDKNRFNQTRSLIGQVRALPQVQGLPVIYTGDYNSHEFREYDGPRAAFNQIAYLDGDDWAASKTDAAYNSANGWRTPAPRQGAHTDHVYVPRSVGVSQFEVDLEVDGAGRWLGRIPSDHNPVRTLLEMPY
ncbi:fibronectin type III domain-containing protein [Solicola sp. PLA-1-18]|uniref:fibronectin type III domain-containing protein n=1 Tax=Solicola sp. PLA-1-18 TaxID=3380532 RepID=UPI003B816353